MLASPRPQHRSHQVSALGEVQTLGAIHAGNEHARLDDARIRFAHGKVDWHNASGYSKVVVPALVASHSYREFILTIITRLIT